MSEQEKFELIERYLSGELTATEQERFQELWATDPNFAEEVEYHELVDDFILDAGLLDVKQKLNAYTHGKPHNNSSLVNKLVANSSQVIMASLAFLLVSVGIGIWLISASSSDTNNAVKSQKNQPQITEPNDYKQKNKDTDPQNSDPKSSPRELPINESPKKVNNQNPNSTKVAEAKEEPNRTGPEFKSDQPRTSPLKKLSSKTSNFFTSIKSKKVINPNSIQIKKITIPESIKDQITKVTCKNTTITSEVETAPSCKNKPNGVIKVLTGTISGGKAPYSYKFKSHDNFTSKAKRKRLQQGYYTIAVKDSKGCKDTIAHQIEVKSEECGKRSFTFVPEKETRWKFPFEQESPSGKIKIFYEGGRVYNQRINNGIPIGWNGRLSNGKAAPMGLYRVVFNPNQAKPKIWLLTVIK